MRAAFYLRYSLRGLVRDRTRTLLGIFCIAVGVMAIVSLQLAGLTVKQALSNNIREENGGDVSMSFSTPVSEADLGYMDELKRQGDVSTWTATAPVLPASMRRGTARPHIIFDAAAVDPSRYPLVGRVVLAQPAVSDLSTLLRTRGNIVLTQSTMTLIGARVGDHLQVGTSNGTIEATLAGVIADSSLTRGTLLSLDTLKAVSQRPVLFNEVKVLTPDHAAMLRIKTLLKTHYQDAEIRNTDDVRRSQEQVSDLTGKFLKVVGLVAILVGGIGIVNTMQVLLSRRRLEIAMLKTFGFRQPGLFTLFGLEALWLGLAGGALGAGLGVGLGYGATHLVENLIGIRLNLVVDPAIVSSGFAVGASTALIFGLLPIVRSGRIRPLAVIRDLPEQGVGTHLLTAGMLAIVAALFFGLAWAILNDALWAAISVVGIIIFLGIMTGAFALAALLIGRLPIPERFTGRHLALVAPAVLVSALITYLLPGVGVFLLLFTLSGLAVVILPKKLKVASKLALRGIGRQPVRSATTLVALFVGVFAVGLILIIGQGVRTKIDDLITNVIPYNIEVLVPIENVSRMERVLPGIAGLQAHAEGSSMAANPIAVNGIPASQFIGDRARARSGPPPQLAFSQLAGIDASQASSLDQISVARDRAGQPVGRLLGPPDVGSANAMLGSQFSLPPWNLKPGDTVTLEDPLSKERRDLTIVGFYDPRGGVGRFGLGNLNVDNQLFKSWGAQSAQFSFSLKVAPDKVDRALAVIDTTDPLQVILLSDLGVIINQALQNVIIFFVALASLSLLAGVIIIANAVALAMLERRREIGILKAVGYGGLSVLGQVLLENAIIGGLGGVTAMSLIALVTTLLGKFVFKTDIAISVPISLGLVLAASVLAASVAALVSWRPTRIRPLEVLRYE